MVEAPPGTGKTTRVPPAIAEVVDGEVICVEPRRLAARMAASRVAHERGERLGETVGYQVRFEEVVSERTRIRYVTEGILGRRLVGDPELRGVGAVVLDEFHERHLAGDLALALLRRLKERRRPDLRIVVMSATLEAEPVQAFLGCESVRSEGRPFPVEIEYLDRPDDRRLEEQVASALRRLLRDGLDGDVLVFLPGSAEIARARDACRSIAERHGLAIAALHGDLPPAEQDRAVSPGDRPKVILSTNVAETSITIEGVRAVIDSGLARVASHSPFTGLPSLRLQKISRASAAQRAGRAGRTAPGRCLRLYTRHDHDTRPAYDPPEIRRLDLSDALLQLHAAGVARADEIVWLEPPPSASVAAAEALLGRLGAIDERGALTEIGRRMLRLPLHPRLARIVVEGERRGVLEDACLAAAILGERDLRRRPDLGTRRRAVTTGDSDVLEAMELFLEGDRGAMDRGAAQAVDRAWRHLLRIVKRSPAPAAAPGMNDRAAHEAAVRLCLLAGFPDRVARRRRPGSRELLLASGGALELDEASVVSEAPLVVVVDAEERRSGASAPRLVARAASAIEPDWLLDLAPDALRETAEILWNPQAERVEVVSRLWYDGLVLDETRRVPSPAEAPEAARLLADAALAIGLRAFVPAEELDTWLARLDFVARTFPDAGLAPPTDETLRQALAAACEGLSSFAELRNTPLLDALRSRLSPAHARLVAEMAPEKVTLPGGRAVRVRYERGQPPWIESRLQDFFGMTQGPAIAGGRVPLVLHLLAPNGRAQQVTTDLAGFWRRHYPAIRQELARRYPRHAWPEDPTSARPPMNPRPRTSAPPATPAASTRRDPRRR